MKFPKEKLSKYINKSVIIAAIIGIILSFFLEKIFNPICEAMYSFALQVGDYFIVSFSNATYQEIALGLTEKASYSLLYFIYFALVFLGKIIMDSICDNIDSELSSADNLVYVWNHPEIIPYDITQVIPPENEISSFKKKTSKRKKNFKRFKIFITSFMYVLLAIIIMLNSRQVFICEKTIAAINDIEIVAPYISDYQYKQFKSDFYLIKNKQDYDSLLTALKAIASQENITLPKQ